MICKDAQSKQGKNATVTNVASLNDKNFPVFGNIVGSSSQILKPSNEKKSQNTIQQVLSEQHIQEDVRQSGCDTALQSSIAFVAPKKFN